MHSAFRLTQSRTIHDMSYETLQNYRHAFANVKCVIVDEISMIGNSIFHCVEARLQHNRQVWGELWRYGYDILQ